MDWSRSRRSWCDVCHTLVIASEPQCHPSVHACVLLRAYSMTSACLQTQRRTCCTAWRIRMLSREITAVSVPQAFCCVWFVARVHLKLTSVVWCCLKVFSTSKYHMSSSSNSQTPYNSYWADLHWLVMTRISASKNIFRFWLKTFWRDEIIDKNGGIYCFRVSSVVRFDCCQCLFHAYNVDKLQKVNMSAGSTILISHIL